MNEWLLGSEFACVSSLMTRGPLLTSNVPLAPHTTLELGGPAELFATATNIAELQEILGEAKLRKVRLTILGGGSNVLVPDEGVAGLVLAMRLRGREVRLDGSIARVTLGAGEPWDEAVRWTVDNGWQGLECLSGIPGLAGATPIQNVGAYGQEVAETLEHVEVIELTTGQPKQLTAKQCGLGYRDSALKRSPGVYAVTSVTFALKVGAPPSLRYSELIKALEHVSAPTLLEARETVLRLRRTKSMVLDANDENHRSVGSFFMNPIVSVDLAREVVSRAQSLGLAEVPQWAQPDGTVKLAAGWLIERAGVTKGFKRGAVGVSSKHALALVHHGGGSTTQLLALAKEIAQRVQTTFGVTLNREAVLFS